MANKIKKYGLVGYPLGHSFSKDFFARKFANEGIDAEYVNFEIDNISRISEVLAAGVDGLNVTIPYKQQIMPYLDRIDPAAQRIGAVNVVKIERTDDGKVSTCGYNSDIVGFTESIRPMLDSRHRRALILGTGGASKAVRCGLEDLGLESTYVSRRADNGVLTYADLTEEAYYDTYLDGILTILESHLADMTFGEATTLDIPLEKNSDGLYTISEDTLTAIQNTLLPWPETDTQQ